MLQRLKRDFKQNYQAYLMVIPSIVLIFIFCYIPMYGMIQSFNVSVASAIILSEACCQREAAGFYDSPRLEPDELERRLALWLEK